MKRRDPDPHEAWSFTSSTITPTIDGDWNRVERFQFVN
jgi:hypothetical protein